MDTQNSAKEGNVRPWGRYDIIDTAPGFQVKRISVDPGKQCSYQRHQYRSEHWILVAGIAAVTLDDVRMEKKRGDIVTVPVGSKHRIENIGADLVVFIEVQMGDYLQEDDIERFEDDFGRPLGVLLKKT
jgi:mannose-6-phosphate isomerase-like protein (cupin superfamily)